MTELIGRAAGLGVVALFALAFGLGFGESAIGLDFLVPGEVGMVLLGAVAQRSGTPLAALVAIGVVGYAIHRRRRPEPTDLRRQRRSERR